jgi:rhodanese-related sulfurtransferase
MSKKLHWPLALLLVAALLLGACGGPAATPSTPPTQPVIQATAVPPTAPPPTDVPEPTLAPVAELDIAALLEPVLAGLNPDTAYGGVAPAKLSEELASEAPFLVDVREPTEVAENGYIEGAINLPIRTLTANLDKLPALDAPIVVYCASGVRGGYAITTLRLLGYTNVRNLSGGLGAWAKAGLPVETGAPPEPAVLGMPAVDEAVLGELNAVFEAMPDGYYGIKADALNAMLADKPPFLVDLRSEGEWNKDGYLEGAVNVPLHTLMANLDQLPAKDEPIVLVCASGYRGTAGMLALRLLGYTNVSNLSGGLNAWKAAELPVVGWVNWTTAWTEFLGELPANGMYSISAADLNLALVENPPFLLDVREAAEIEADGHIAGAVHIPIRALTQNLDKLPALDAPIVVYCASGHRGGYAAAALHQLGYRDVRNLGGGLGAWKKAELPLEAGLPAEAVAGMAPEVDATALRDLDTFLVGLPDGFLSVKAADLNLELGEAAKPVLVDVRTADETANGYIEGALLIPIDQLMGNLSQIPDKQAEIVIYCASGHRGAMGLMALKMLGYANVRNLGGGMNAWVAAELPITSAN